MTIKIDCHCCKGTGTKSWNGLSDSPYPCCNGSGERSYSIRLPRAYILNDEKVWEMKDVLCYYPDVRHFLRVNNIQNEVKIVPVGSVDEDCLYVDGVWKGYLSDNLWMRHFGDFPETMEGCGVITSRKQRLKVKKENQ